MRICVAEFYFSLVVVNATIDINIHQLQYVADHLDKDECRQLTETLHHIQYAVKSDVSISKHAERPCIFRLLRWDKTEGNNKTFNQLAFTLVQIGRNDLADFLSKSVIGEEDLVLKENFLNNPFRRHIPQESVLIETGKRRRREKSTIKDANEDDRLSPWEIACIISGSVVAFVIISYMIYKLFGTVITRLFRNLAPDIIVGWCDLVHGECTWCYRNVKRKFDYHVIGRKQSRRLTDKDKNSLIVLNRNLNNCMDGELESVSYLFSDLDSLPVTSSHSSMLKYS